MTPNIDEIISNMEEAAAKKGTWMLAGRDGIEVQDDASRPLTQSDLKLALEAIRKDIQALARKENEDEHVQPDNPASKH